ncbi:MAG TPA: hypothetical protein VJV76_04710 [Gaiellaceae bacterium]|nr:hypothetical protein [Gaiellaceae bacterium]
MTRQECWDRLAEAVDARRQLWCAECGRRDDRRERGWTLQLDDEAQLHAFCPVCDLRFGLRPSG